MKKLTEVEWTTCIMAIRYAMNGQTIATATLPQLLVEEYWNRWSDSQKKLIAQELKNNEQYLGDRAYGNSKIDRPKWLKFRAACDRDSWFEVTDIEGNDHTCFKVEGRIYPLDKYINQPHAEIYLPEEHIEKIYT